MSLKQGGSRAVEGFMNPEGVCIYHEAKGHIYKVTFDDRHKNKIKAHKLWH